MPDDALPAPPHDPDAVRAAADALLDERRYREGMGLAHDEELRGFIDLLRDRVQALLEVLFTLQETHPALYWALVVGLSAVMALLIWHIVYTVRRGSREGAELPATLGDVAIGGGASGLWEQVAQAERDGDLALALRLRFALAVGARVGIPRLRALRHLTYRELVAEAVAAGRAGGGTAGGPHDDPEVLGAAVRAIEATYYAGRPLSETLYQTCADRLGERGAERDGAADGAEGGAAAGERGAPPEPSGREG